MLLLEIEKVNRVSLGMFFKIQNLQQILLSEVAMAMTNQNAETTHSIYFLYVKPLTEEFSTLPPVDFLHKSPNDDLGEIRAQSKLFMSCFRINKIRFVLKININNGIGLLFS